MKIIEVLDEAKLKCAVEHARRVFEDHRFSELDYAVRFPISGPNRLFQARFDDCGPMRVLVVKRSTTGKDYPLSDGGLHFLLDNCAKSIIGVIALTPDNSTVVNVALADDVWGRNKETPARDGDYGAFRWIDENFYPTNNQRRTIVFDPDAPF